MRKSNPRLTVEITEEQYAKLRVLIPHGMQKQLFHVIVEDIIKMTESYGYIFIAAMIDRGISYRSMIEREIEKLKKRSSDGEHTRPTHEVYSRED